MKSKTKKAIKELEEQIKMSYKLPIFRGYAAIQKAGLEKIIDDIYKTLPEDVKAARNYLRTRKYEFPQDNLPQPEENKKNTLYDLLKMLEISLDEAVNIVKYSIINIKETEDLINRMYDTLPEEIKIAEKFDK